MEVFEEWAAMKIQEEGAHVAPVIEEMRASLMQRLSLRETSETSETSEDVWPVRRATRLELPVEKNALDGLAVRPVVVKRRSKVPENWDGPGGTVVLIDKPQGEGVA